VLEKGSRHCKHIYETRGEYMKVQRLSKGALVKLLDGKVDETATCVIKFYSNTCELCHNFHDSYADIAKTSRYPNTYFFAFNIADHPTADYELGFEGVPTVVVLDVKSHTMADVSVCPDPENPHPYTFLTTRHVADFISSHIRLKTKNTTDLGDHY
jgi:hypothetical protein